jgi:hypothetical protein
MRPVATGECDETVNVAGFPYGCHVCTTEISEVPSTTHPLGMRPAGEGGTTPALAVVANAVVDALSELGVQHLELPLTPERVWRALNGKAQRSRSLPDAPERECFGAGACSGENIDGKRLRG